MFIRKIAPRKIAQTAALILALTAASSLAQDAGVLTWQKLSTLRNLPPRAEFASAYDPVSKLTVIFGGRNLGGLLDETWVFDGQGWSHLVTLVHPPARATASMGYDRKTRKV